VAFDGNLEVAKMLANLPYFKEIIDDDGNDVKSSYDNDFYSMVGLLYYGLHQEKIFLW
jgi:hypothetical protein